MGNIIETSLIGDSPIITTPVSYQELKGDKGDPFLYTDFTPTELESLRSTVVNLGQKFVLATAVINGDFKVTIPGASGLATNDIVKIAFPVATNGASNARLSIDGGTTYKNIMMPTAILASTVQSKQIELIYDGTNFVPFELSGTNANGTWVKHFNGRMEQYGTKTTASAVFIATGSVFYRSLDAIVFPVSFFAIPVVLATLSMGNIGALSIIAITATDCNCTALSAVSLARACNVQWLAEGTWK